jgi:FPC/CPF motif-containing protein YcgG
MLTSEIQQIVETYKAYLDNKAYPCIAARAAVARQHIKCMVAGNMACPKDDRDILDFLYHFVDEYRASEKNFHSVAIIFKEPQQITEEIFDHLLWQRLQALTNLDAENYQWDARVSPDTASGNFSFSIKEEAFFIIGLHACSSRKSRQFHYPALVFNPHAEFQKLRATGHYESMKEVVRKRDIVYSGSANPMLKDFGETSEVYQYSGRTYKEDWSCPLIINNLRL